MMTTPEELLNMLTNKLIEIALDPKKRSEYSISYMVDSTHSNTIQYYRNRPMISNIEPFTLASYYCKKICVKHSEEEEIVCIKKLLSELEKMSEEDYVEAYLFISETLKRHFKTCDSESAFRFYKSFIELKSKCFQMVSQSDLTLFLSVLRNNKEYEALGAIIDDMITRITSVEEPQFSEFATKEEFQEAIQSYVSILVGYVDSKSKQLTPEWMFMKSAILQAYDLFDPTEAYIYFLKLRDPKLSFDRNYFKAEKGDKKAQKFLANAYRTGKGVMKNQRLADFWGNMGQ